MLEKIYVRNLSLSQSINCIVFGRGKCKKYINDNIYLTMPYA